MWIFIIKQIFSIILLSMLILLYFRINNKKILVFTSYMLVAYIPLRRFFRRIYILDAATNISDRYPVLEIVDIILPILILIMTFVVGAKYKKYKSLNKD